MTVPELRSGSERMILWHARVFVPDCSARITFRRFLTE